MLPGIVLLHHVIITWGIMYFLRILIAGRGSHKMRTWVEQKVQQQYLQKDPWHPDATKRGEVDARSSKVNSHDRQKNHVKLFSSNIYRIYTPLLKMLSRHFLSVRLKCFAVTFNMAFPPVLIFPKTHGQFNAFFWSLYLFCCYHSKHWKIDLIAKIFCRIQTFVHGS